MGIHKVTPLVQKNHEYAKGLLRVRGLRLLTGERWGGGRWNSSLAERRQLLWGEAVALELAHLCIPCNQIGTTWRGPRIDLEKGITEK